MPIKHKMFIRTDRIHARDMFVALMAHTWGIGPKKMLNLMLIVRVNVTVQGQRISQRLSAGVLGDFEAGCPDLREAIKKAFRGFIEITRTALFHIIDWIADFIPEQRFATDDKGNPQIT